ncbi:MAG: hypothetical protein M5U34_10550 [Chloroflexi bacterium]|nr:hypothetical protein [Chloroflexota bacterium]
MKSASTGCSSMRAVGGAVAVGGGVASAFVQPTNNSSPSRTSKPDHIFCEEPIFSTCNPVVQRTFAG